MTIGSDWVVLDSNIWIFGLQRQLDHPACGELLNQLTRLRVCLPRQILRELQANLANDELHDLFRLLSRHPERVDIQWERVGEEQVRKYLNLGCRLGDAGVVAAWWMSGQLALSQVQLRVERDTTKNFGGYPFSYICAIQSEHNETGKILRFNPQSGYMNTRGLSLNRYGAGPFCRFRIPRDVPLEGVYVLLMNGSVQYAGECINLSSRFNSGYGQISPRTCYYRGQSTNCKINHLILRSTEHGKQVELWFFSTDNRKVVQSEIITKFKPPWNTQGLS